MFTSTISRIWLLGLVLFAATPFLIAARPQPTEPSAQVEQREQAPSQQEETQNKNTMLETTSQNERVPAAAPLASGK